MASGANEGKAAKVGTPKAETVALNANQTAHAFEMPTLFACVGARR
jgi:hypothetical protein